MQMTPHKKILEDIMPLRIIREVEKWPVIYKKDSPEMANAHFRYKVWEEVAKNLFENYHLCSDMEKQTKVNNLIKKWRNLRDTFKRQLVVEKKIREGHIIKKKEYVYFKHMAYLLPHMTDDDSPGSGTKRARQDTTSRRGRNLARHASQPPATVDHLDIHHIDEDKHFLLSLLPSLKRMNDDEKLTAKMEILKVIKDVKNNSLALDSLISDDTHTLRESHLDEDVVVKSELFTVEMADYKSPSECGSVETE